MQNTLKRQGCGWGDVNDKVHVSGGRRRWLEGQSESEGEWKRGRGGARSPSWKRQRRGEMSLPPVTSQDPRGKLTRLHSGSHSKRGNLSLRRKPRPQTGKHVFLPHFSPTFSHLPCCCFYCHAATADSFCQVFKNATPSDDFSGGEFGRGHMWQCLFFLCLFPLESSPYHW